MGGQGESSSAPARDLPAGPEVPPTFPRRTRASISNDAPYPPAGGRITRLARYYVFFSLGSVKPSRPAMGFARFFFRFFFRAGLRRALSSESDDDPADEPADGAAEWRGAYCGSLIFWILFLLGNCACLILKREELAGIGR